ncbi:hypothetical protein HPB52_012507 [Rhipicephalus sanguineus]|uniref:Transposable element P transposase-like GTP-binding insertion domain-containing protein n=1 Tax=Rhipicephalus sanguineus TaxID=34632 RepID=A0A9D4PEZ0_RHISA|nr:hypothetical protein HPB52_012507 [Rhipicephalus sanguineus]
MDLMRVKFATQVFSRSMASAITYYTERNVFNSLDTAGTVEFIERMNDLFDAMNRRYPGVRQAAGENDHADMPTLVQLYRMLAVFSVLKPPQFGNCEAREEAPAIDFAAFRAAFKN